MDEELNGDRPDHEPLPDDAAARVAERTATAIITGYLFGLAKRSVQVA